MDQTKERARFSAEKIAAVASGAAVKAPAMMLAAAAVGVSGAAAAQVPVAIGDCRYDREAMLALPWVEFDQDLERGWRAVRLRPGCERAAANLIAAYRERHPARATDTTLTWHEGQLRASIGDYPHAIALMERSRTGPGAWGFYVDGTIAFLKGDREAIEAAGRRLLEIPKPDYFDTMEPLPGYTGPRPTWPPYVGDLNDLLRCFGQPYAEAYGCEPRK